MPKVAIFGGGVAGMSAAHELCIRGFEVDVYERNDVLGGKARSFAATGSGKAAKGGLPAEHGFRFFPGFYKHLPDTMKRIPTAEGRCVFDNLVHGDSLQMARWGGKSEFSASGGAPESGKELLRSLHFLYMYGFKLGIRRLQLVKFMRKVSVLALSCEERLLEEREGESWWTYSGAEHATAAYQNYLADGITRTMVAAKARELSARTAGSMMLQLSYDMSLYGHHLDRVLNGPTTEVWIDPWRRYLEQATPDKTKVTFHMNAALMGLRCEQREIKGATVEEGGATREVTADHYVVALPMREMRGLLTPEIKRADPKLADIERLQDRWMNGVMLYLDKEAHITNGHTIYADSPWALTSISQRQFWRRGMPKMDHPVFGRGEVKDILSVDLSDWERPGLYGKPAKDCSADEIKKEVWDQIRLHLNDDDRPELGTTRCLDAVIDPAIHFCPDGVKNDEPLLINHWGTWDCRPEAVTGIKRLFLASDYVKTHVDLATMEGANEAARCAVNGILKAQHSSATPCMVKALEHPPFIAWSREIDRARWESKHPNQAAEYFRERPVETTPDTTVEADLDGLETWLVVQNFETQPPGYPAPVSPRA